MFIKDKCDYLVVGDDLAGLMFALSKAQQGKSVVVITERNSSHKHFSNAVRYLTGLTPGFEFYDELQRLGFEERDFDMFQKSANILQIVTPKNRLNIPYVSENLKFELQREFGIESSSLLDLYKKIYAIPSTEKSLPGINSRSKDEVLLRKYIFNDSKSSNPLRHFTDRLSKLASESLSESQIAQIHASSLSDCAVDELTILQFSKLAFLSANGVFSVKSGIDFLKKTLKQKIRENDGQVRDNSYVTDFLIENNAIKGVLLSTFEGIVKAKNIIVSTDARNFFNLIPSKQSNKSFSQKLSFSKAIYWKLLQRYRVRKNVIPVGIGESIIYSPPLEGQKCLPDNYIRIIVDDHNEDYTEISAEIRIDFNDQNSYSHLLNSMSRIASFLTDLMPFLNDNIISIFPDHRKGISEISALYPDLKDIPYELKEFEYKNFDTLGIKGFPVKTPYKNIFICGRDNFPGLGVYGEVCAYKKLEEMSTAS